MRKFSVVGIFAQVAAITCPDETWKGYEGRCFKIFDEVNSFDGCVQSTCRDSTGHGTLARVQSATHNDWLMDEVDSGTLTSGSAWIGYTKLTSTKEWAWLSNRSSGYESWDADQSDVCGHMNCAAYIGGDVGYWIYQQCDFESRCVCEWPARLTSGFINETFDEYDSLCEDVHSGEILFIVSYMIFGICCFCALLVAPTIICFSGGVILSARCFKKRIHPSFSPQTPATSRDYPSPVPTAEVTSVPEHLNETQRINLGYPITAVLAEASGMRQMSSPVLAEAFPVNHRDANIAIAVTPPARVPFSRITN